MNSKVQSKQDEYLRIKVFAKKMDMSEKTLRRWCAEGRVTHVRFARTIRIPLSELNRLVTEGTVPARIA
jgi:excisionase family DNA binding protein